MNRCKRHRTKESLAMAEQPPSPQNSPQVQANLHELVQVLREADHLEPEVQEALANLVDELSKALTPAALTSTETAHLARCAAGLAQSLHQQASPTLLSAAKRRLEQ